jgi:hypothetical protein
MISSGKPLVTLSQLKEGTFTANNTSFAPGKMAICVVENRSISLKIFYKMTQE